MFPVYVDGITFGKIIAPSNYVALSKDLSVEFQTREILPFSLLNLKVSYVGATATFLNIAHINFYTDDQSNSTRISVPCAFFTRAGTYILHVEGNELNTTLAANRSHHLEHKLDVRWPNAKLSVTHETIETYPSEAVNAVIEFPEYLCQVDTSKFEEVPTFQLELTFCGMYNVNCDSHSVPPNATFPIQLIYGIEKSRVIALNCEYFGLAGNYVLRLRPLPPLDASLEATAYIEVIREILKCDEFITTKVNSSAQLDKSLEAIFFFSFSEENNNMFPFSHTTHTKLNVISSPLNLCVLRSAGASSTFST